MEPERRIEKWLRAFAKKRREQAGSPMELRPAMRERLHREVARQSEEKGLVAFISQFIAGFRHGLAFIICFVILATGAWLLWPQLAGRKQAELSMNKLSEKETLSRKAVPPMAPPPVMSPEIASGDKKAREDAPPVATAPAANPPTVASANRAMPVAPSDLPKERDRAKSTLAQQQATIPTTVSSTPSTNASLAFANEAAADSFHAADALSKDSAGALASASVQQGSNPSSYAFNAEQQKRETRLTPQSPSAASASSTTELFDQPKAAINATSTLAASQVFNRLGIPATRRNAIGAAETPAPVLLSFRVEQNGNDMKIIDADGSIYTGAVQIAQQEPSGTAIASAAPQDTPASRLLKSQPPASQTYFFRVAGTNRILNQNVVFSGNFVPLTNSTFAIGGARAARGFGGGGGFGGAVAVGGRAAGQPVEAVLSNSEIKGTLVIGDQKAVDLIATPAP